MQPPNQRIMTLPTLLLKLGLRFELDLPILSLHRPQEQALMLEHHVAGSI
nr:hypothetical protein Q903MT_gene256 [Picea sitchensis]